MPVLPCFQPTELSHIWCLHPFEGEEIDLVNLAAARRKSQHLSLGTSLSGKGRRIETPACPYLPWLPLFFSILSFNLVFCCLLFTFPPFPVALCRLLVRHSFLARSSLALSLSLSLSFSVFCSPCYSVSDRPSVSIANFSLLWFHSFNWFPVFAC